MSMVVQGYLQHMEDQREALFRDLKSVSEAKLWSRPDPKRWSGGEQLDTRAAP
jgi:hypothetical protein